jgi:predicted transcriptional regulator
MSRKPKSEELFRVLCLVGILQPTSAKDIASQISKVKKLPGPVDLKVTEIQAVIDVLMKSNLIHSQRQGIVLTQEGDHMIKRFGLGPLRDRNRFFS